MSIDFKEFKRIDCREVARRLGMEIDRSGKTRCFHSPGDANPSLQIYPDGFKCFRDGESGDQIDLVSQYLGISKSDAAEWIGREFNVQQPPSRKNDYGKLEREHIYPGGTIKKCMYRRADKSKYGEWYHLENGKWLKGRGEGIPPLYPSSDNLASHIFLTEGEKDVDTWRRLGKSAISLPNGSNSKWYPEYMPAFEGKSVYIIEDNDAPGRKYAQRMAATLKPIASGVKVLDLSNAWKEIPEKGDTTDLIEAMGDEAGLMAILKLAQETPEWEPPKEPDIFDSFGFYSVPDLTPEEKKPPEFIVDGMIPCGMTFLSGAPKIRKSFMALQLASAAATGSPFLSHNTRQCDVAYLDLEGSKSRVSFRAERMSMKIPRNVFITNSITERLADGLVDKLRQLHRARPSIRLIIIDTYSRARGSYKNFGVNAYDADVALLEPVQRMALEENIAVVFIHHDKKGAGFASDSFERLSGTMGISGSSDCVINLVADGKRFDGRANMEYTPRDAKGGEVKLVFDERFGEWQEIVESKPDLRGNPVCNWIIENAPDRQKEGKMFSYDDVIKGAYGCFVDNPGTKVREQIDPHKDELFSCYGIGVQMGVKSHGDRGVRIINLL